jgi:galactokinase
MDTIYLLHQQFISLFGKNAQESFFSPGRVNLIGEHIDYNGGNVLPAAISLGITALVSRREDSTIRIYSNDFKEECSIDINLLNETIFSVTSVHWSHYILATLLVLKNINIELKGADILLESNLPLGAGLSSSAALECLIGFIFNQDFYQTHRTELALDAQTAERKYIGVNCGIMDQFVVANGKKDNALLLNCATLEFEYIPAKFKNCSLVIINSNKARTLADSKYNERRSECEQAFEILSKFDMATDLCHIHEISLGFLEEDILYQRAKHAILENKRVLYAAEALKQGNMDAFGQILTESHISLNTDYEVSCYELNMIVHYSTHFDGCLGARMTGAGFGGCCIALVEQERLQTFINYVGKKYTEKTKLKADFYVTEIVDGVKRIKN